MPDRKRKLSRSALLKDQRLVNEEQQKMLESVNVKKNLQQLNNLHREMQQSQNFEKMKSQLDHANPAGMFNAHRKPPAQYRFDDNMRQLRTKAGNANAVQLQKQNRALHLIQQREHSDTQFKNELTMQGGLPHTDFEGYRAISRGTINQLPSDVNGLKDAMKPTGFVSPLRQQRLSPPRSGLLPPMSLQPYQTPQHASSKAFFPGQKNSMFQQFKQNEPPMYTENMPIPNSF